MPASSKGKLDKLRRDVTAYLAEESERATIRLRIEVEVINRSKLLGEATGHRHQDILAFTISEGVRRLIQADERRAKAERKRI